MTRTSINSSSSAQKRKATGPYNMDCQERALNPYSAEDAEEMTEEGDIVHNAATFTLDDAKLQEKDFTYYWFGFGGDWMHRLRLEKIYPLAAVGNGKPYAVREKVGASPAQYEEEDDSEEDDE